MGGGVECVQTAKTTHLTNHGMSGVEHTTPDPTGNMGVHDTMAQLVSLVGS